jgi:putative holliday junction resolvase
MGRMGRIVGLDVGERRIGVAISDATGTLARPVGVLAVSSLDASAVTIVADRLAALAAEEDGVEGVVVGLPRRLDGSPNAMTARTEAFVTALRTRTGRPVALQDERLTSVEAEHLLAVRQKDWRVRKARLDAAAAAVILQEYLDARQPVAAAEGGDSDADADSQEER